MIVGAAASGQFSVRAAVGLSSEKVGIWIYYRLRQDLPASTRKLLSQLIR